MIIRMEHVRQAKMCSKGARSFFRKHNLDWQRFITTGLDEEEILATGDAMARRVVEVAHVGR